MPSGKKASLLVSLSASVIDAGLMIIGTGSCACVGVMGPGLGGGHGRYQGFYGLIIDGLISMNVVLANGSAITVSNTSYPDLWWAMRGAGHNFGIVTSFHAEIHKRTVDEWYISEFVFTQDQLESVFEVLNSQQQNGGQPKELMNYGVFTWASQFSTTEVSVESPHSCSVLMILYSLLWNFLSIMSARLKRQHHM